MASTPSEAFAYRLIVDDVSTAYKGFFRIDLVTFRHQTFQGALSKPLKRELFGRGQAVLVLLYDLHQRQVLLVEQCRAGALGHAQSGAAHQAWLLEPVAGMIDPGETPIEACQRETWEEAGCRVSAFEFVCQFYPSPGGSDEILHLYAAQVDLSQLPALGGAADEDEDIRLHVLSFEAAYQGLMQGRFNVASTLIALQWLFFQRQASVDAPDVV